METEEKIGRWVMIRHFKKEYSEYYNPETDEGVGGPKYKYDDYIIKAYSTPVVLDRIQENGVFNNDYGTVNMKYEKFYFNRTCYTQEDRCLVNSVLDFNDEVYDLSYYKKEPPTIVYTKDEENIKENKTCPKVKYRVKQLYKYSADQGLPQYFVAMCERDVTNG